MLAKRVAALSQLDKTLWHTEESNRMGTALLVPDHQSKIGLADPSGLLQNGIEYGLQLTRRPGNDVQYLGAGGLLLQCRSKLLSRLIQLAGKSRSLGFQAGGRNVARA